MWGRKDLSFQSSFIILSVHSIKHIVTQGLPNFSPNSNVTLLITVIKYNKLIRRLNGLYIFYIFSTGNILVVIRDMTFFLVSCYSTSYIYIFS